MKKSILGVAILSFILFSCEKKSETMVSTSNIQDSTIVKSNDSLALNDDNLHVDEHNSKNSLDWNGTYHGIIPCADCEGIHMIIELNNDETFKLTQEYLDKDTKFEESGQFTWSADGGSITLNTKDKGTIYSFKVGEGRLIQLDQEGKEITGALANKYILMKK